MPKIYQLKYKTLLAALILVLLGFVLGAAVFNNAGVTAQQDLPTEITDIDQHLAALYDQVAPSVVAITVTTNVSDSTDPNSGGQVQTGGSGFVIDMEGHIVTNYHVVQDAGEIVVYFFDGTITRAEIVGEDADADVAVIQVDLPADRLHPLRFGNVDDLFIGESVIALGSPFGNDWTLTSGIISALDRTIPSLSVYNIGSAIQTDAAINPGNSGGPLLDLRGEVIGVNAQIASETRSNSGIGFAIPADLVQRVAKELIETGEVSYSVIGIRGGDVDITVMESLGLENNQRGVVVSEVLAGSPAEDAGLRNMVTRDNEVVSADIILEIDGHPTPTIGSVLTYLARFTRPGDVVTLTVLRDGQEITLPLTLGSRSSLSSLD